MGNRLRRQDLQAYLKNNNKEYNDYTQSVINYFSGLESIVAPLVKKVNTLTA